jgi:hypothetical protein
MTMNSFKKILQGETLLVIKKKFVKKEKRMSFRRAGFKNKVNLEHSGELVDKICRHSHLHTKSNAID